jgi:hypothetical protein
MMVKSEHHLVLTSFVLIIVIMGASFSCIIIPVSGIETWVCGPFNVTFYDKYESDGVEIGDKDWEIAEKEAIQAAIAVWDEKINNIPGRQIEMHLFWDNLGTGTIGVSYAVSNGNGTTSWTYAEHIWRDGVNYDGRWDTYDVAIIMDIDADGAGWNIGEGPPSIGELDFRTIITHEIGHMLGFWDTYDAAFDDWGNTWGTESSPYEWAGYTGLSTWDKHLVDGNEPPNRPFNGSSGTPGNFNETSNPVYFNGSNAVAVYGELIPIYAPSTYSGGASLIHLVEEILPSPLMRPYFIVEEVMREPTLLEWAMMRDMGWNITHSLAEFEYDVKNAPSYNACFVYPDYEGSKPSGVYYASLSDWTAIGFIIGMCSSSQNETTDTDPTVINTSNGMIILSDAKFVLFGGPLVNSAGYYYENNRIAPVYWGLDGSTYYWYLANGTKLDSTGMPFSQIAAGSQDMFLIEVFTDSSGNVIYYMYGYGWKGTFAAGKFFKFVIAPDIANYTGSFYVFRWTDTDSDSFVDLDEIDTTPVVQG